MPTLEKLLFYLKKQNKKMKLHDYLLAIPLIMGILLHSAHSWINSDNMPTLYPAKKVYVSYGSINRADDGNLQIINELGVGVFPGNPIETQFTIMNNDDKPWTGKLTLTVDKVDKQMMGYFYFEDIRQTVTIPAGEAMTLKVFGYIDPAVTLTDLQQKVGNNTVMITLVAYDDTEFKRLFWSTKSLYYFQKYFDKEANDYTKEHYEITGERCKKLIESKEHKFVPWVCSHVINKKPTSGKPDQLSPATQKRISHSDGATAPYEGPYDFIQAPF